MKLQGQPFTNSPTCSGISFTTDAPLDMARIVITGRYPTEGWVRNRESHETVYVLAGEGELLFEEGAQYSLKSGDVVHVPPERWFRWSGDMTILMACSPVFKVSQYEKKEDI